MSPCGYVVTFFPSSSSSVPSSPPGRLQPPMETNLWDEAALGGAIKCEGNLNFSTVASEDDEYGYHKKKLSRDPLSHRIIEKRRRDRMNNCLADLSRLLPSEYMKKGRGRIEKTEIIEMAIKHMKHLQSHPCTEGSCCPVSSQQRGQQQQQQCQQSHQPTQGEDVKSPVPIVAEHYKLGFHECLSETMHFLVEVEGFFAGDTLCVQLITHLQRHCENILKGSGFLRLGGDVPEHNGMTNGVHHLHQQHGPHLGSSDWLSPSGRWSPLMENPGRLNGCSTAPAPSTTTGDVVMTTMTPTKEEPMSAGEAVGSAAEHHQHHQQHQQHRLLTLNARYQPHHHHNQQHPHPDTSGSETASNHASNSQNELSPSSQHSEKTELHERTNHLPHSLTAEQPANAPSPTGMSYKFKNNIRKRFAHQREEEEHHHQGGPYKASSQRASPPMERRQSRNSTSSSGGHNQLHPDTTTASTTTPPNSGISVPIFALSTRGSYYIPLSIDYSLLAPQLDYYHHQGGSGGDTPASEDSDQSGVGTAGAGSNPAQPHNSSSSSSSTSSSTLAGPPPGLVLHPVTISVNFRPPRLQARDRDYYHLVDNT